MKRAAIFGSLVDFKNVNAHKCVRLTIDIPAEQAAEIVAMFGWPTMASPVPVALARMAYGEREPVTRTLAQQAGALCADAVFRAFLNAENEEIAAAMVRELCDVESRAEIKAGTRAGDLWLDIVGKFHGWQAAEQAGAT